MAEKDALLQARCTAALRQKCELAATECEMTLGEWLRAIAESACEVHFADHEDAEEIDVPEPAEDPEEYLAKLDEDAARMRLQELAGPAPEVIHPGLHADPGPELNARDCPHLPQWTVGGRCSRCKTQVAPRPRVASGGFGRFGGGGGRIPGVR
jgi:hypothetical protein